MLSLLYFATSCLLFSGTILGEGYHRVLAHIFAQNTPSEITDDDVREYARSSLRRWNENRLAIPNELSQYVGVLVSVFDDLQR
jgi:hypothetical protein